MTEKRACISAQAVSVTKCIHNHFCLDYMQTSPIAWLYPKMFGHIFWVGGRWKAGQLNTAFSCDCSHCIHQPAGDAVIHNVVCLPPSFQKPSLLNWNKALLSWRIRNLKSHVFHYPIWQTQTE